MATTVKKYPMLFDPRRHNDVPEEMQMKTAPGYTFSDKVRMVKHVMTFVDEAQQVTDADRCNLFYSSDDVETKPAYQFAPMLTATPQDRMMYPVEVNPYPNLGYVSPQRFNPIGEGYAAGCNGYYYWSQNNKLVRFTTFLIEITDEIQQLHLHENSVSTIYRLRIFDTSPRQAVIEIPKEKWDSLETKIKEIHPAWCLCKDVTSKASDLFKRLTGILLERSHFNVIIGSSDWGWGLKDEVTHARFFFHGNLNECCCEKALLDRLAPDERKVWLSKAWSVLEVGNPSVTIPMLTYGACAYLDALFCDAGCPLDFALMVMGNTGFLKTTFCRVLYNVFEKRQKQIHSIRGTAAAMRVLHQEAFDDVLVVDDFNLEGSQQEIREKTKNFQALIRAYSDKTPREKYAGNHQVTSYAIRGGLVITGETQVTGQLKSSELRYLRVVFSQRPDGKRLQAFQDNPEIMKHFWSEFIYYLEQNYHDWVQYFKDQFPSKRGLLATVPEPRLRDDYAHLLLAWETLMWFLSSSNVISVEDRPKWTDYASKYFEALVRRQCADAQQEDPYIRYVKELWNLIGTGKVSIARNLEIYVENLANYIGYAEREKGVLWVKADPLFAQVKAAFFERGEHLPLTPMEILRQLKEHNLTSCNQGSTLMRASSKIPGRPRMVVLKVDACEAIVNQM